MIRSMTAYGRGEYQTDKVVLTAEARSLNNRYRDVILRLPRNLQPAEEEIRSIVSSRVKRGRIEVTIQMEGEGEDASYELELNVPLVKSYLKVFNQLAEEFGIQKKTNVESLCQMKDVILMKPDIFSLEEVRPGLKKALSLALDSMDEMRRREGEAIKSDFMRRLQLMEEYTIEIEKQAPLLVEGYRQRLRDKVQRMLKDVKVDETRLAQEVAYFAERSDVTEEIVRIKSHLKQFHEYLSSDEALGRRLDFLIQELHREINTLGAKASDSHISSVVVEMKAELEKLREQVQNVE